MKKRAHKKLKIAGARVALRANFKRALVLSMPTPYNIDQLMQVPIAALLKRRTTAHAVRALDAPVVWIFPPRLR